MLTILNEIDKCGDGFCKFEEDRKCVHTASFVIELAHPYNLEARGLTASEAKKFNEFLSSDKFWNELFEMEFEVTLYPSLYDTYMNQI